MQGRNNIHVVWKDLHFWLVKKQKHDQRKYIF